MSTCGLFSVLFDLLAGSPHYMVTGSLSFLPLIPNYREPGPDLDVFIRRDVFEARRRAFETAGTVKVLRVPEVAIAGTSLISRVFMPKTGFVHIDTSDGMLDVVQYEEHDAVMSLLLGLGVRFSMDRAFCSRCNQLEWSGYGYTAAPPEFMFVTKAIGYVIALDDGTGTDFEQTKHYADLVRMAPVIDWDFAAHLLHGMRVGWRHAFFPTFVQKRFNPYVSLDLTRLRGTLA
jgi:hypothetical protein